MSKQKGFGLLELLIGLFIASILLTSLFQFYLTAKARYVKTEAILSTSLDVAWIRDMLADSIRRAGFTPCLGINQLIVKDRRESAKTISALITSNAPEQFIQVNRMSEHFSSVVSIKSPGLIYLQPSLVLKEQKPVLICDCIHAEVHTVLKVKQLSTGTLIQLSKPLLYSYSSAPYLGAWLEEKWFIHKKANNKSALYYQLVQKEELSPIVHSMNVERHDSGGKRIVKLGLGLDENKIHQVTVAVRAYA
jgi:prepilin-type N-terminal cleavage/methylation domain-containing protein